MQASSVKIGWKVIAAMGIYGAVVAVRQVILGQTTLAADFEAFTGLNWSDFTAGSPKPAEFFLLVNRISGAAMFLVSLFFILIAWKSYSRAQKWSWYTLLVSGIIIWSTWLVYYIAIGYLVGIGMVMFMIGVALFVAGIALPAKAILSKKSA